ncbi:hypothetical protein EWM57_20380, partial [Hymenobacter persicinus]
MAAAAPSKAGSHGATYLPADSRSGAPAPAVVAGETVTSFTLVNADTDQDIQTLAPGAVINLSTLPTRNLNIRA